MAGIDVAEELFRRQELSGWVQWQGNRGFYGGQNQLSGGDHLCTELHFRRFPLRTYGVSLLIGNSGAFWLRPGDSPPSLRDYHTGQPVAEDKRGMTLREYVVLFTKLCPTGQLRGIVSCGDFGANENRGALTPDTLLWIPHSIDKLAEERPWLICWKTGLLTVEQLCVEGELRDRPLPVPLWCGKGQSGRSENLLPSIKWAITGLPVIIDGQPCEQAVWELDDDLRHVCDTPPTEHGLFIMERALQEARARGWHPGGPPLEIDLSLYGDPALAIAALLKSGYCHAYRAPEHSGQFQLLDRNRVVCWPKEAHYPVSIIGLCRDGTSLASFIARAQLTKPGYLAPSVSAQLQMVAPYFSFGFMVDEGRDPSFYDMSVPPNEFLVRGQAGGRLSAVLCVYEQEQA